MFLKLGLNNEKYIDTLPLRSAPFLSLHLLSLPLQSLPLVSLVSLINKTKRIAERSDTNCDTHTQSHTDRQSTLDKYMINAKERSIQYNFCNETFAYVHIVQYSYVDCCMYKRSLSCLFHEKSRKLIHSFLKSCEKNLCNQCLDP